MRCFEQLSYLLRSEYFDLVPVLLRRRYLHCQLRATSRQCTASSSTWLSVTWITLTRPGESPPASLLLWSRCLSLDVSCASLLAPMVGWRCSRTMLSWYSHILWLTVSRMSTNQELRNAITMIEAGLTPSPLSLSACLRSFLASPLLLRYR